MTDQRCHFNAGTLATAFVFSAPGRHEAEQGRPVAKSTGDNLNYALDYLNRHLPSTFKSADRYAYRITNAFSKPLWKHRDGRSEASVHEVRSEAEVNRVIGDVEGCDLVILCGDRPHLLQDRIQQPGRIVLCMSHTSIRSLVSRYRYPKGTGCRVRAEGWAKDLLTAWSEARARN